MNDTYNLTQAESMWVLGLLRTDELPKLAATALAQGIESESILQLAICSPNDTKEAQQLFKQILQDAGGGRMSKIDALRHYARQISALILSADISPLDGARLIWGATINAKERGFHDLDGFIYAASEMEDRPEDKDFFENEILGEARRWAEQTRLGAGI